jgi:integrase
MPRLTKRRIDATVPDPEREIRLWDDDPRGFGLRIKSSGVRTFFVQYRSPITHGRVRYTIGQYSRLTVDQARAEARKVLGGVARGDDPARERRMARQKARSTARTIAELCDEYMRDARAGLVTYRGRPKKDSTLAIDEGRIRRHIKPLLGARLVSDVTGEDVETFMHAVRMGRTAADVRTGPRGRARVTGGTTTASRTVDLLGSIFSYAVKQRIRPGNPVAGVERPPPRKRDRALSPDEYWRLGEALDALSNEGSNPVTVAAVRALALSGCRRNEIFGLRRDAVDTHQSALRFDDTKTGQQVRPIGVAALSVLCGAPSKDGCPFVFPAARGNGHIVDVKVFREAVRRAGLEGITPHSLRHGFASVALELGYSELTIAGLLGHRVGTVTARYTHHVDRALVTVANRVSATIAARMAGKEVDEVQVVPLPVSGNK